MLEPYFERGAGAKQTVLSCATIPARRSIARHLLRPQDRLSAIELHPEEAERLKALFAGDFQVRVIELDGWLALGAHLPPKEKRGLVLVDPPFEQEGEFDRLVDGLAGRIAAGRAASMRSGIRSRMRPRCAAFARRWQRQEFQRFWIFG